MALFRYLFVALSFWAELMIFMYAIFRVVFTRLPASWHQLPAPPGSATWALLLVLAIALVAFPLSVLTWVPTLRLIYRREQGQELLNTMGWFEVPYLSPLLLKYWKLFFDGVPPPSSFPDLG